tara:strand:- start:162 stop:599 length:438 start_codon:yes stop_codon:yes gene_type:complete
MNKLLPMLFVVVLSGCAMKTVNTYDDMLVIRYEAWRVTPEELLNHANEYCSKTNRWAAYPIWNSFGQQWEVTFTCSNDSRTHTDTINKMRPVIRKQTLIDRETNRRVLKILGEHMDDLERQRKDADTDRRLRNLELENERLKRGY